MFNVRALWNFNCSKLNEHTSSITPTAILNVSKELSTRTMRNKNRHDNIWEENF